MYNFCNLSKKKKTDLLSCLMSLNCRTLTLPDLGALPLWVPPWKWKTQSIIYFKSCVQLLHWGILGQWKILISFFWDPAFGLHLKNVYYWNPATKMNIANLYLKPSIKFKSRSQGLDLILDTLCWVLESKFWWPGNLLLDVVPLLDVVGADSGRLCSFVDDPHFDLYNYHCHHHFHYYYFNEYFDHYYYCHHHCLYTV